MPAGQGDHPFSTQGLPGEPHRAGSTLWPCLLSVSHAARRVQSAAALCAAQEVLSGLACALVRHRQAWHALLNPCCSAAA